MPAADERRLIEQARTGSREAFRMLVERHMKTAYNLAFALLESHEGAEDVAQEAMIRVHRALPRFRGDAEFSTWLHRIVVNLALNRRRGLRRTVTLERAGEHPSLAVVPEPDPEEVRRHIERALHELPTLQRAAVILRHLEGLSTRQVGSILRCSEGTVKTHLFRAMRKLRKSLCHLKPEAA